MEEKALINVKELGKLLGLGRSSLAKLKAQGKLPSPIRFGRCLRYDRRVIENWISLGCPSGERFVAMTEKESPRRP